MCSKYSVDMQELLLIITNIIYNKQQKMNENLKFKELKDN